MIDSANLTNKTRRILRELLVCAMLCAVILFILDGHSMDAGTMLAACGVGLLVAPALWGTYRLSRFVLNR